MYVFLTMNAPIKNRSISMIGNASHTKTALPDKDNSHAESSRNTACDTAIIKLSVPRPNACRKPVSICVVVVRRSDAAMILSAGIPISRTASDASNMASRSCGTARKTCLLYTSDAADD